MLLEAPTMNKKMYPWWACDAMEIGTGRRGVEVEEKKALVNA